MLDNFFYNLYTFDHEVLHIHFWDLPAFLIAAIMVIMVLVHHHNQKKRDKEFQEKLEQSTSEVSQAGTR